MFHSQQDPPPAEVELGKSSALSGGSFRSAANVSALHAMRSARDKDGGSDWNSETQQDQSCCSCSPTAAIALLIVLNDLCCLVGLGMVGVFAWELTGFGKENFGTLFASIGITFGSLLFTVSFVGCCGAMHRTRRDLRIFVVLTVVLVLCEAGACTYFALALPPYRKAWTANSTDITGSKEIEANDNM